MEGASSKDPHVSASDSSPIEIGVLGPLALRRAGSVVLLPSGRQRAILALLCDRVGESVSVDTLVREVWGDEPPSGSIATLQAHVSKLRQVIGKETIETTTAGYRLRGELAAALASPERQLQHAALRLSVRGWEALPLPAPDGSGAVVAAVDVRSHQAVLEHTDGRTRRVPLGPDRPFAHVTRDVLEAVSELVDLVRINPTPQETPWTTPLDEDYDHATYTPHTWSTTSRQRRRPRLCSLHCEPRIAGAPARSTHGGASSTQSVLRRDRRPAVERLHHPQLGYCPTDRSWLVAR
jgi:hypothetical protein